MGAIRITRLRKGAAPSTFSLQALPIRHLVGIRFLATPTGPFADFDDTCFIGSVFGEIVSDPGSQASVCVDQFNVVVVFNP
ncbi:MAG TPA: hypothetical protein VFQ78_12775, partial [Candidatus Udaeobacter sp.]|nr:hypothetical protein [Candidatus Udaeobacter sp.]